MKHRYSTCDLRRNEKKMICTRSAISFAAVDLYLQQMNFTKLLLWCWTEKHIWIICVRYWLTEGTAVAQWLRCCATNQKVAGSIPAGVSGFFFDIKYFRSHYGPGVDSASNRNEYQEYFLGVKVAGVTKSGNLNFLEPSGTVQACNGTSLPLPLLTDWRAV